MWKYSSMHSRILLVAATALLVVTSTLVTGCGEEAADTTAGSVETTDPVDRGSPESSGAEAEPVTSGTAAPTEGSMDGTTTEERAALMAAVAAHRIRIDNGFGDDPGFETILVVEDLSAAPSADGSPSDGNDVVPVDPITRDAITAALTPASVTWTTAEEADAALDDMSFIDGDDEPPTVLRLSRALVDGDTALVHSQLDCGPTCGITGTHEFVRSPDGTWTFSRIVGSSLAF